MGTRCRTNKKNIIPNHKREWSKYYEFVKPQKEAHDWVHKECLNCGEELILEYKRRSQKFCNLSCSTSYRNKHKNDALK